MHEAGNGGDGTESVPAIRFAGVTKDYPGVRANDDVTFAVAPGSIHGLLGENGAGKSTLMKILFGLVHADEGKIALDGEVVRFRSPADALQAGVGMVQQHFSLIADFTIADNLVLGHEPTKAGIHLDIGQAVDEIQALSDRYGFRLDPRRRVGDLAVGARQRVEILKALYRGARILILDEPTAALAPQEVDELFTILRALREQGRTIIFISHKLPEVLALCDRVTVLRDGKVVGEVEVGAPARAAGPVRAQVEHALVQLMVGRALPPAPEHGGEAGAPVAVLDEVTDGARLGPLSLTVHAGEILGVAGVEGNGQTELVELLLGVRPSKAGRITLDGTDITHAPVRDRLRSRLAHIAEDRHVAAVALGLSVADNAVFGFHDRPPFAKWGAWLALGKIRAFAAGLVRRFNVRAPSVEVAVADLSGGNQQKLVVAREMARQPRLMIAAQPTRGLDIGATAFVHEELVAIRNRGGGVLLVSLDLTEVLTLADRIVVLAGGRIAGEARPGEVDTRTLGAWMTGGAGESVAS